MELKQPNKIPQALPIQAVEASDKDAPASNPAIIWHGTTVGELIQFADSWVGDDLEECLQSVYDNRTQAKF
jgi:hypothetical protein